MKMKPRDALRPVAREYIAVGDDPHTAVEFNPRLHVSAVAAMCILTTDPWADRLTGLYASSYLRAAAQDQAIFFRFCMFHNESAPAPRIQHEGVPSLRIVEFQPTSIWTSENQCVLKILLWLRHASVAYSPLPLLGYLDRDVWLEPLKLARFYREVVTQVGDSAGYVGMLEHASRYNASSGKHAGFSFWPVKQRWPNESFPFAMGALVAFTTRAVDFLLAHVERSPAETMLTVNVAGRAGKCSMTTDVAIGWMMAAAFVSGPPVLFVRMRWAAEMYSWPSYGGLAPASMLAVHNSRINVEANLRLYRLASTLADPAEYKPVIRCHNASTRGFALFGHARCQHWSVCENEAKYSRDQGYRLQEMGPVNQTSGQRGVHPYLVEWHRNGLVNHSLLTLATRRSRQGR